MPFIPTTKDSNPAEPPLGVVCSLDELDKDERATLLAMPPEGDTFKTGVISDLRANGDFGPSRLVLSATHIAILEREDDEPCQLPLETI